MFRRKLNSDKRGLVFSHSAPFENVHGSMIKRAHRRTDTEHHAILKYFERLINKRRCAIESVKFSDFQFHTHTHA